MREKILSSRVRIVRWIRSAGLVAWGTFLGFLVAPMLGIDIKSVPNTTVLENIFPTFQLWVSLVFVAMCYETLARLLVQSMRDVLVAVHERNFPSLLADGWWLFVITYGAALFGFTFIRSSPEISWAVVFPLLIILGSLSLFRGVISLILGRVFNKGEME